MGLGLVLGQSLLCSELYPSHSALLHLLDSVLWPPLFVWNRKMTFRLTFSCVCTTRAIVLSCHSHFWASPVCFSSWSSEDSCLSTPSMFYRHYWGLRFTSGPLLLFLAPFGLPQALLELNSWVLGINWKARRKHIIFSIAREWSFLSNLDSTLTLSK